MSGKRSEVGALDSVTFKATQPGKQSRALMFILSEAIRDLSEVRVEVKTKTSQYGFDAVVTSYCPVTALDRSQLSGTCTGCGAVVCPDENHECMNRSSAAPYRPRVGDLVEHRASGQKGVVIRCEEHGGIPSGFAEVDTGWSDSAIDTSVIGCASVFIPRNLVTLDVSCLRLVERLDGTEAADE